MRRKYAWMTAAALCGLLAQASAIVRAQGPVRLQVDNLTEPLGLDDGAPSFSWQLSDPAPGARQSAYRIEVAASEAALMGGHADIWDSGRVNGDRSLNVRYTGPALKPSTRYFWRVTVWGADGTPYRPGAAAWWETGLLTQDGWKAAWIGYETAEETAVRHAPAQWIASPASATPPAADNANQHFAFRTTVTLAKPVKSAALYATAQDTVAAWVNGKQAIEAQPFPPYRQMPWKKFVRADVTALVAAGTNTVAIEQIRYARSAGDASNLQPMIATLFVEYADGSTATFASDMSWKTSEQPADGWHERAFAAAAWTPAVVWKELSGPMSAPLGHPWIPDSVKVLRHDFSVGKPIRSARLYATALGAYNFEINGKPVSRDVLAPGWSDYRQRVYYQTYDVTGLVAQGRNALGALLAPGWYSTPLEWFQQPNNYGDTPPALRAQLRIEYEDGSVEWIATGTEWQASTSPILSSEIYDGETVDARRIQSGWSSAGFNATGWHAGQLITPAPVEIIAQDFAPIRVEREMHALAVTEPKPGVYVYDFGQNHAGIEWLRITGPAGTDVRVRFAEILNDDGTLYTDNLRTAKATDHFILAGRGVEEFTPRFTFHGYRYAEITGLPAGHKVNKDTLTALVIHTDAPFAASLTTGNALVNKVWSNIQWGQRSNFVGVPTDCPQRDERLGWAADAQVFWRAASYNMNLAAFSRKFATDLRGTQAGTDFFGIYAPGTASAHSSGHGAGWSDAGVIVPWTAWLQTGDTRVIDENWAAMEKYLAAIEAANPDHLWKNEGGIPFGDWLSPEGQTQYGLVATAYWAYDTELMRQMAHANGNVAEEQKYAGLFEEIRAAFQQAYVRPDGFVLGADKNPPIFGGPAPAPDSPDDTQTGYVLALHMNLLPEALRAAAAEKLVAKIEANHGLLGTGFLGTPYLLEELTKTGHADEAYKLLLNTQYPSWGYLIEHGATTMWERWNGDQMKADPGMNSYNHYAYGAVGDWIARYAAGIDTTPLDAGFHAIVLQPHFDTRLGSLDFTYDSSYGPIHSAWTVKGSTALWHVTLPANTTGWLSLNEAAVARWSLNGVPLAKSKQATRTAREGKAGYEIPAGEYTFTVALP
ncbi:MAG: family 78 glycoside hydrolase catalytic domain [Acidobacteriaceae bacterium]|nr:family 78 glycoside hydrolase catalytic domain [Acidobacteriaceae bacterium]